MFFVDLYSINNKSSKMKKIIISILFIVPTLVFSQKSAGKLSRTDDLSKIIESLAKDYETNSFVIYDSGY